MSYFGEFDVVSMRVVNQGDKAYVGGVNVGEFDADGLEFAIYSEDYGSDDRFFVDAPKAGEDPSTVFEAWVEKKVSEEGEDFRNINYLTEGPNSAKAFFVKSYS